MSRVLAQSCRASGQGKSAVFADKRQPTQTGTHKPTSCVQLYALLLARPGKDKLWTELLVEARFFGHEKEFIADGSYIQ